MTSKQKISTMADSGRKSGRAVFDNQGRASWEWQTATGVFETDVSNEQLQRLEAAGLALLEAEPSPAFRHPRCVSPVTPMTAATDAGATRATCSGTPRSSC